VRLVCSNPYKHTVFRLRQKNEKKTGRDGQRRCVKHPQGLITSERHLRDMLYSYLDVRIKPRASHYQLHQCIAISDSIYLIVLVLVDDERRIKDDSRCIIYVPAHLLGSSAKSASFTFHSSCSDYESERFMESECPTPTVSF